MTHVRRPRRVATAGVVAAIVTLAAVLVTADAQSAKASTGACGDANGVTVVVDFSAFGGGVDIRCAPSGSMGDATLTAAGFTYTPTQRNPGFICQINDLPSSDCQHYPPGNAYWSYWIAARGGHWCYSTEGAATRRPPAGTVEGWAFSLPDTPSPTPGVAPPPPAAGVTPVSPGQGCSAPAAATTTTAAPAPAPPAPTTPNEPVGAPAGVATTTTARGQSAQSSPAGSDAAPDTASSSGEPTTTTSSGSDVAAGAQDVTITDKAGSGSPVGLMVSGGLIALLAGGGYLWARRRRLPGEDLSP